MHFFVLMSIVVRNVMCVHVDVCDVVCVLIRLE
jgi:hypothetical protein